MGENECRCVHTFEVNSGHGELLDKESRMLRAPPDFALCGFYVILLQICSQTWICGKQSKSQHF